MSAETAGVLTIGSAEGVSFSIPLAGPISRFLAWAIDAAVIMVALSSLNFLFSLFGLLSADFAMGAYIATNFFLLLAYRIVLEWRWRGQTVGKRLLRLRVKDERGLKLRFDQVVLRNLLRMVDILPGLYLVGGLTCLFTQRNQRLGDIAAGTVVTIEPKTRMPDVKNITGDKYNSFRDHPHLEARLRQATPPAAAALAMEAIARRDELDATDRLAVFHDFAAYFRGLVAFPDDQVIGITDEQYVRNAIDTIYNARERTYAKRREG